MRKKILYIILVIQIIAYGIIYIINSQNIDILIIGGNTYVKYYKNNIKIKNNDEITDRVKRDTTISTKLDMVITGNVELKNEIKGINDKFDEISKRVTICEEKTKSANKRIEKLENKVNYEVII